MVGWKGGGRGGGESRNEHPRRDTRRVVGEIRLLSLANSPLTLSSPSPFPPSSVSSFCFTSCTKLAVDHPSFSSPVPSSKREEHGRGENPRRVLPRERKTRRTRACPRRGSLVPRHSGLPFTLQLFYFIFRGDKCLRGFAGRLGKCFHNVLLCRGSPFSSLHPCFASPCLTLPRLAASL